MFDEDVDVDVDVVMMFEWLKEKKPREPRNTQSDESTCGKARRGFRLLLPSVLWGGLGGR